MEQEKSKGFSGRLAEGLRKTEIVEYVGMLIGFFASIPGLLTGALGVLLLKKGAEASLDNAKGRETGKRGPIQVFPKAA